MSQHTTDATDADFETTVLARSRSRAKSAELYKRLYGRRLQDGGAGRRTKARPILLNAKTAEQSVRAIRAFPAAPSGWANRAVRYSLADLAIHEDGEAG